LSPVKSGSAMWSSMMTTGAEFEGEEGCESCWRVVLGEGVGGC
jgi:hypothetical protein